MCPHVAEHPLSPFSDARHACTAGIDTISCRSGQDEQGGGRNVSASAGQPEPGSSPNRPQWYQDSPSPFPWEQDGLDHVRRLMPPAEPYRAWATFQFAENSGRVWECDLLIATTGGLYLVELKAHPGTAVGKGRNWKFKQPGDAKPLGLRNPLFLTDIKSKSLKSLLSDTANRLRDKGTIPKDVRIPMIEPAVFLSAPDLKSELVEEQTFGIYGRDDCETGLQWIWRDLLNRPPQGEPIQAEFSRDVLPLLLDEIGIAPAAAHLNFGDDWELSSEILNLGPTWEDRLATNRSLAKEEGRARIYLIQHQASAEGRRAVERAAQREYQLLSGINHRGIVRPKLLRDHRGCPAILFEHRESDLSLDAYLELHGNQLTLADRLGLVRQLAEAMCYAHSQSLYHRALTPSAVYVSARSDGSRPVLRIIDWQTAARDFDTTGLSSIGKTTLTGEHLNPNAELYLAPEFEADDVEPVDLDVFGLGALAYLLISGQPPAATRSALGDRLREDKGLHLFAVIDGVSDELDQLVFRATRNDPVDRIATAEVFRNGLDAAEHDSVSPEAQSTVDLLTSVSGQTVDGDWVVDRVLGTGATARALLVSRTDSDNDGNQTVQRRVFKVALDEDKADRLRAEARALENIGGGVVIRLLGGPREVAGRTVLELEYAGGDDLDGQTLGTVIRSDGSLTYHNLQRYGNDLFRALDQLAGKGIRHRDLKPDNFGIFRRADRSTQLMLFDFSLADASDRDIKAGTRGYLDPFLGSARRPVYDDHAERYAAAVTLHEMASRQRPVWGDGIVAPLQSDDVVPTIAADVFDSALRDGLTRFFLRAFHRDVDHRFDSFRQMEEAWRAVFTEADAAAPPTTPATANLVDTETLKAQRDAAAEAAQLDTLLDAAGLSPRAVSVAHSFSATTVEELLQVPRHKIAKARGAGAAVRKELNGRHKQWSQALQVSQAQQLIGFDGQLSVDDLVTILTPVGTRRGSSKADVIKQALGLVDGDEHPLVWPTQAEVAGKVGLTQAAVSRHLRLAAADWAGDERLAPVRRLLVELCTEAGRIMTVRELAAALRVRRGASDDDPERSLARAMAVVRAAVEAEVWDGTSGPMADTGPRLAVVRRGERVLVALESLSGGTDPSAPELADYALALGKQADQLVIWEPLPGRGVVVRELRAVEVPDGMATFADTRLVGLAAAMSENAEASPRLELYPRELPLAQALRISQAGAGVRRDRGITVDELKTKVRARFPALDLGASVTYVQLETALHKAGFPLQYDVTERKFHLPKVEQSVLARSSSISLTTMVGGVLTAREVVASKLTSAVQRGGFLALTLRGGELPGTAAMLAARFPVQPVDVDQEFLRTFRALADERGADWQKVRTLDLRLSATGEPTPGLASFARKAWDGVRSRVDELNGAGETVLLLHHLSLLQRYYQWGGREFLTELQNDARYRSSPHGLWLLCPAENEKHDPHLDDRIVVECTDSSEWAVLSKKFLNALRGQPDKTASALGAE
ncbi:BREX system serine/threonine kinase PglW [Pseudonocardiaceae bacterium YIM PH 21723]|nr:BREX system serine/threonine kinase PglW [Pseudonocardiaceae bacterium YIM PH 21723]